MICPQGCQKTVEGEKREPVQMYHVDTVKCPYDWHRCPACGWIVYRDKGKRR